jgi:hypothetical protein
MYPSIIQILDYKHADWTKYKHFITDNVPQITPTRDPDEIDRQIDQLTTTINTAKELAIKIKNIPKNKRPLLPRILNLLKLKRKLFRSRQEKLAALNIRIEPLRPKKTNQCHRCQLFGHIKKTVTRRTNG